MDKLDDSCYKKLTNRDKTLSSKDESLLDQSCGSFTIEKAKIVDRRETLLYFQNSMLSGGDDD